MLPLSMPKSHLKTLMEKMEGLMGKLMESLMANLMEKMEQQAGEDPR